MHISAVAAYTPEKVVANDDLQAFMTTNDEWIRSRTGIAQRHVVTDEQNADLAQRVAEQLLEKANITADQLDFIIVATMSGDSTTPGVANRVQGAIGATNAAACDLGAACAGFVYALDVAAGWLLRPDRHCGLVIGSETLSHLLDWHDRRSAILFGDGAAGVLVTDEGAMPMSRLRSIGQDADALTAGGTANLSPFSTQTPVPPQFMMDGRRVFNFATSTVPRELTALLETAEMTVDQVDYYLLHQANGRIVESVGHKLGIPADCMPQNIARYGNTSAASIPLLLNELVTTGKIQRGMTLALCGFGGGLNVASMLLHY